LGTAETPKRNILLSLYTGRAKKSFFLKKKKRLFWEWKRREKKNQRGKKTEMSGNTM
jgi:hypothetical protein